MSQSVTLAAAYLAAFSPLPTDLWALHLIQPDVEAYSKPHPLALFTEQIIALLGCDPDKMHLAKAMNADDKQHFVQAM
jgi:hypothetical protein